MSRRNSGRRYHRGDRPADGASPTCECGASRRRPDGTNAPACPRCMLLDGTALSPAARALISELRQLGRATWEAIAHELPEYDRRSLYRAIKQLDQIGRVRRVAVERTDNRPSRFRRTFGQRRGYHRVGSEAVGVEHWVHLVAAFELVEPSS